MRKNNKQDMTIMEQLNIIVEEMCDKYCKYPQIYEYEKDGDKKLEIECKQCPIGRIGV